MKNGKPKVAIVHDWLVAYAGADRVVDCMHHVFPDAPIYTLVYDENNMPAWFKNYDIRTTYLQKLPFATKLYRASCLPELYGDTARYFDPYDYDVDLDALFAKPAAPPDKVLAKYSWEKTARFWLDEIKKCAEA